MVRVMLTTAIRLLPEESGGPAAHSSGVFPGEQTETSASPARAGPRFLFASHGAPSRASSLHQLITAFSLLQGFSENWRKTSRGEIGFSPA